MKRLNNLWQHIITFDNLLLAYNADVVNDKNPQWLNLH